MSHSSSGAQAARLSARAAGAGADLMAFDLTDDQLALRDGIRSLVGGRFPISRVREGFDASMHRELAEAGVFSLRADGFGWTDAVLAYEELGRGVIPGPLVASFGRDEVTTAYEVTLRGAPYVEHAGTATDVLRLVDGDAELLAVADLGLGEPEEWPLDPLTPVWRVEDVNTAPGRADRPVEDLRREGALLTAAYCVGMADRLTELAVDYAQERKQFDRPIGSFQALKHILADMAVRTELARVSVHAAACVMDDPETGALDRALSGAKLLAGEAAVLNGRSATQAYGGMGFTWEVDVHLFLKRAWVLETHNGSGDHHADAIAGSMAGPA
jgi:alkylation response protein AidB-like acyl-CoA dehydrogenase